METVIATRIGKPKYHHGLVIGRFMPLHKGHLHLIDAAISKCEEVTILVGTLATEPIDGHVRYEWVKNTYSNCHVVHSIEDGLPAWDAPDYWERWVNMTSHLYRKPDVVFTSEIYGDILAPILGIEHIQVDLERKGVPISATAIRGNPFRYWDFLAPACRNYFAKRVLIYGPESTGKSRMCAYLADYYNTVWVPEFARDYMEGNGNLFDKAAVDAIVIGQLRTEEDAAQACNRVLFCDTDMLLTRECVDEYGIGPAALYLQRLSNERRYDLYLFLDTDLPWEDDGTRVKGHRRAEMREAFIRSLESRRIQYHMITGIGQERYDRAVSIVNEYISAWNEQGLDEIQGNRGWSLSTK